MDLYEVAAKITLKAEEYAENLKNAISGAGDFSKAWTTAGNVAAAGFDVFLKGVGAAAKAITETAKVADNIDKASQKLGVSAEFYQEWDAVLQHSGASMEGMTMTFRQLATATQKTTEAQSAAFGKLGIAVEDVKSLSTEQVFEKVISKLQEMEEGTERTAIATELLGRGSMELGPLLNTTAEETQAMIDRVHELGGVMSDEAVKGGAAFQDSLQDLQTAMDGAVRNIAATFMPSLANIMDGLAGIASGDDSGLAKVNEGVADFIAELSNSIPKIKDTALSIITGFTDAILDNAPMIIDAGADLIIDLALSMVDNLPRLVESAGKIIEAIVNNLGEVDWAETSEKLFVGLGKGLESIFSSALGVIDAMFGTHLQKWYNEVTAFWRDAGAKLYEIMNGDAIEAADVEARGGSLVNDVRRISNQLLKAGLDAEEALRQAESQVLDTAEKSALYNKKGGVTLEDTIQRMLGLEASGERGTTKGDYYRNHYKVEIEKTTAVIKDGAEEQAEAVEKSSAMVTAAVERDAKQTETSATKSTTKKLSKWEDCMKQLDHMYATHQISEASYWKSRQFYLEKYSDEESEEWWKAVDATQKHYDDLSKAEQKAIEEASKKRAEELQKAAEEAKKAFNAYTDGIASVVGTYQKRIDDLSKTISNYSSKLTGSLSSVFDKDENGRITGYSKLEERKAKVNEYFNLLKGLKKSGLAGALLSMFQELSLDEGLELARYLNTLSGTELDKMTETWNSITDTASQIGEIVYSDQAKAIVDEMQTALDEAVGDGEFSDIGERIVDGIVEGMKSDTSTSKIKDALNQIGTNAADANAVGNMSLSLLSASTASGREYGAAAATFIQNIYSPTELTRNEIANDTKDALSMSAAH